MTIELSGATRVIVIVGDPIAQVKAPGRLTAALRERGHDIIVVPVHVTADDVDALITALGPVRNLDGIIATVPHKFAAHRHCATASERARFLGAVNLMRRGADGAWHGDMLDGVSFLRAMRRAGQDAAGRRILHVGAGGAGRAIALALAGAGPADLAIHDSDAGRRDALVAELRREGFAAARAGSADPSGFDIVVNATPAGMRPEDPLPVDAAGLSAGMHVGDVVTAPEITPLLVRAHAAGATVQTGIDMFDAQLDLMVAFLTGKADA
ncbi:shikimate dehydrogenase [Azospirillum sp. RWY-5-1]|uniref:Shikimate dehydrogenase n=1 Tax=Azospirillum oleiclasticum TaxID=2735135 RepID=A0ABX2TG51_9PROT|nr:shikimate dehydrogenase [Azospirillum oleiclasticum]NYZ14442.1 shikimate dehydrogenase [Azospirillum oleiclasticum]NYZ23206.1 shikimate dehydrogenase [Azospirillum oleiclasticum]